MNRKRINVVIPRGFDWPKLIFWRIFFFFVVPFAIIVILPGCESRASNDPEIQRLVRNKQSYELHKNEKPSNFIEDDWEEGNLYIGQSGKPWGSMSVQQQESPSVNFTHNGTKNNQLLAHDDSLLHKRFKRGVIHLYNMIVCATGCNPLAYKGYGCYCGFLGSGYVIDGIDRCCKMHDWCYDATDCPMFSEYFVPYYWRCYHGYKPVCAVEHGNWGGSGSCSQRLCECDRSFAECLKRYPCPTTKAVCTSSPWRLVQNLFMVM